MEFLAERRINPVYGGTYLFCPADTIDDQIQRLKYSHASIYGVSFVIVEIRIFAGLKMIKTCQNPQCLKEFEPEPRLAKRQRFCHKCAQLPVKARQRTEPIQDKVCINPSCRKVFTPRANLLDRQGMQQHLPGRSPENQGKKRRGQKLQALVPVVTAICPRCERTHKMALDWKGGECRGCTARRVIYSGAQRLLLALV